MKPCVHCHRHILESSHACPFCGVRPRVVEAGLKLSLVLGLTLAGCTDDGGTPSSDASTTNAPNDSDDQGASYYAGPSADSTSWQDTTTTTDGQDDEGASYYAGPSSSSTSWGDTTTTTDGTTDATTTGGETDSQGTSTSSSPGDAGNDDEGASYYAGPSSSSGTWGFNEHRPSSSADEEEDRLA